MQYRRFSRHSCVSIAILCWPAALVQAQNNAVTVTPSSVNLTYVLQSEKLTTQTVNVGTTTGAAVEAIVMITNSGTPSPFLVVTPTSCPSTPCTLTVGATSPQAISNVMDKLKPGTYTASFVVAGVPANNSTSVTSSPPVNVTLTVQAPAVPLLTATPGSVNLVAQAGTATPGTATINVSLNPAAGAAGRASGDDASLNTRATFTVPLTFVATVTGNGITLDEATGTVPDSSTSFEIHIRASALGLTAGNHSGSITLTPTGVSNTTPITVPVVFNVASEVFTRSQSGFFVDFQKGGAQLLPQELTVTFGSPVASVNATATTGSTTGNCGNWLSATSGVTSLREAVIQAKADAGALGNAPAGSTCSGFLTVQATGVDGTVLPFTISAGALVSDKPFIQANPPILTSEYDPNSFFPESGTSSLITSTGATLNFTTSNTIAWAPVSPASSTTPESILALPKPPLPSGLADGTYAGTVSLIAPGAANTLTLLQEVKVASQVRLEIDPPALTIFGTAGATTPTRGELQVTGLGGLVKFTATSNLAGLTVPAQTWTAPPAGSVSVPWSLDFSKLIPGTQTGSVTFTPVPGTPVTFPVTVTATSTPAATVTPPFVNLVLDPASGATTEVFYISGSAGVLYRTSNGGATWEQITESSVEPPAGSPAPAATAVVIDPSTLTPGTTSLGSVIFTPQGGAAYSTPFAVTLSDGSVRSITADTSSCTLYWYQQAPSAPSCLLGVGSSAALDQFLIHSLYLDLLGRGGQATYDMTARDAPKGGTKATVTFPIDQTKLSALSPGTYRGNVTIAGSVPGDIPVTAPVSLIVGTAPAVAVTNAASGQTGAVSPGEIISVFGSNIGPATPVGLTLTSAGTVSTTLGNTQVFFDEVAAALTYAGSGQINAVVPYEMGGRVSTYVTVRQNGAITGATNLALTDSAPALFSLQGGTGQGAILNGDGTVNGSSNPAPAGSPVVLFGTGEGPLAPAVATAAVTSASGPTFPAPVLPVSVTIGGLPAALAYAGEAPGFVSGVLQVNALIPSGLPPGPQQIVVTVGNSSNAAQNVTVAVK